MRSLSIGAGCLALLISILGLAACGDDDEGVAGPKTFERAGYPFTFEYPAAFELVEDVTLDTELGSAADETVAIGIEDSNVIAVQKFTLNKPVSEDDLGAVKAEFDALIRQVDPQASGTPGEIAGFPSLSYAPFALQEVEDGQTRLTAIFDGVHEYLINCQSTPLAREAVDAACDEVLGTLERD